MGVGSNREGGEVGQNLKKIGGGGGVGGRQYSGVFIKYGRLEPFANYYFTILGVHQNLTFP